MRKYNPALKGMVDNYRSQLEMESKNSTINYTDLELYNIIEYWSGMSSSEEQYDAIKEDVLASVKR